MYTDSSLIVRAEENILGINKWLNSPVTKKILFAKHFSTRETVYAQSIAIP